MLSRLRGARPRYSNGDVVPDDSYVHLCVLQIIKAYNIQIVIHRSGRNLAYIRPGKKVADFKYRHGGRQELKRGIGGAGPKTKCAAWIDYVKIARAFLGELFILESDGVSIIIHHKTETVSKVQQGNSSSSFDDVLACAAVPELSRSFDVGKMPSHMFSGKGQIEGAVIVFK